MVVGRSGDLKRLISIILFNAQVVATELVDIVITAYDLCSNRLWLKATSHRGGFSSKKVHPELGGETNHFEEGKNCNFVFSLSIWFIKENNFNLLIASS